MSYDLCWCGEQAVYGGFCEECAMIEMEEYTGNYEFRPAAFQEGYLDAISSRTTVSVHISGVECPF